jgi:hypothetical protein
MKTKVVIIENHQLVEDKFDKPGIYECIDCKGTLLVIIDVSGTNFLTDKKSFAGTVIHKAGDHITDIGEYNTRWVKKAFKRIEQSLAIEYYD